MDVHRALLITGAPENLRFPKSTAVYCPGMMPAGAMQKDLVQHIIACDQQQVIMDLRCREWLLRSRLWRHSRRCLCQGRSTH